MSIYEMNLQILCLWLISIGAKLNLIIVSVNLHKSEEACDIYYVTKSFFLCWSHAFSLCTFQEHEMSGITWWKTHGNWKHTCFCTSEGLTIWLTPGCLSIYSYKVIMNQDQNVNFLISLNYTLFCSTRSKL